MSDPIAPFNAEEWAHAATDKIAAIKACRVRTGADLKSCLDALRVGGLYGAAPRLPVANAAQLAEALRGVLAAQSKIRGASRPRAVRQVRDAIRALAAYDAR